MSATSSLRNARMRVVPTILLAFLFVIVGLGGAPTAATAIDTDDGTGAGSLLNAVDPSAEIPVPAGQSDQPAPASREKRVLEDVHTDAVSAFLDSGTLVAGSQADVDGEVAKRLETEELLFHLSDAGKDTIRNAQDRWAFIGEVGDEYWMAPEVRESGIIWPGFSTEDPKLAAGGVTHVDVRLANLEGPGRVELAAGAPRGGIDRLFSSEEDLGAWRLNVPRHVHAFWVFTQPGTYTLTFELTANGQKAQNDYTFVVGDLAEHTQPTSVSLEAGSRSIEQGEPVLLTANVDPANAAGAVQFRDNSTGTVLGHTPVVDGQAQFRADALNPGNHQIVAEFVPTWSTDFDPSSSGSVNLRVDGEAQQRPSHDDTTPVPPGEIGKQQPGANVTVTSPEVVTGYDVSAQLENSALAGHWVSVWLTGQDPAWRGWVQADQRGAFTVNLQGAKAQKDQQFVVKDAEGNFVGWDTFDIVDPSGGGGNNPGGGDNPGGGGNNPGGGGNTPGGGGGGSAGNRAPAQDCRPDVTLDHGHIDAFYVSSANGTAVMQLMEDVTGHRVMRAPETTLMKVKESALGTVGGAPSGVPGRGYWLPLSQDMNLIWPGWDTNTTRPSGHTDVSINITGVDGPGTVSLYTDDKWGGKKPLLNGGRYNLPGTIRVPEPAHTHAHWVFSDRGIYKLTANAVVTNPGTGQSLQTATHTYVFQVGDAPLGDAFCGLNAHNAGEAAAVNAAVHDYAEEALAAAQADAEAESEEDRKRNARGSRAGGRGGSDAAGGFLDDLFGGDGPSPALLAGLLGLGGGLALAGITGGTVWYVVRLRRTIPGDGSPGAVPDGAVSAV
ncbi:choice-of-anchor M domain-containing protein [Leucobacter sp. CSA1]|uniref:Choice-of-anchor M domain-containing protein n=1 Tax=Leucobacter chromiisoli TaxID=2796471 RepID=A0A934Q8L2_9MICO|nr:choice-of-anchor M domain-containing protein [Leucobacter chromiisoli]MBK0419116.1 choice-of-anchor M domain-containing protein [Leucobacter chromiisoli]